MKLEGPRPQKRKAQRSEPRLYKRLFLLGYWPILGIG